MKINNLLLLFCITIVISCVDKENKQEVFRIDFPEITSAETQKQLSNIADQINYTPLDSAISIQMINSLEFADSMFFAGTFPDGLLVYNLQGKLIHKIGKKGSGPGEYSYGSAFTLDCKNKRVYLLDRNKIFVYDFEGYFQKEISLQKFEGDFTDICFSDGLIYLIEYISFGHAKYNWLVITPEGNEVSAKYNSIPPFKSETGGFGGASLYNSQLYYLNGANDTLFVADSKSSKPYTLVNWEVLSNTPANQSQGTGFNLFDMVKTKHYLFLRYYLNEMFYTDGFDSENSDAVFHISAQNIKHRDEGPGIENDLDAGLPLVPKFYLEKEGREYIAAYIYPFELIDHVASSDFKNTAPLYHEKKKELEHLASSLNENDNPVLVLARLKE